MILSKPAATEVRTAPTMPPAGPDSAGANPGPASYRRGGQLAVTDANVMVGKLIADFFPPIFGREQNLPLDAEAVRDAFAELVRDVGRSP